MTGRLCGAEALIRWIDPVKGFFSCHRTTLFPSLKR
ncbi:hypothetical protein LOB66_10320 [Lactobacillus delbrueckii subsp. lactis]|nr:hypothetical protein [Lactobacillus delbrueckii]MCD5494829.1 hypothetical protein [Lactobacillus delbrueckii subsp. lactis]